jgi:hypothetical protein
LGKAIPYGVYDIDLHEAWVSVGISRDTAEFAVEAIRRWWKQLSKERYGRPPRLLITANSGGSNGNRNRLWKFELQCWGSQTQPIANWLAALFRKAEFLGSHSRPFGTMGGFVGQRGGSAEVAERKRVRSL